MKHFINTIGAITVKDVWNVVQEAYKTCVWVFGNAVMFGLVAYWISRLFT